jgi:predicted ATPase
LFLYLADKATVRSTTVASAVTAVNPVLTVTGVLPTGALVAASNPTSGIDPTKQVTNVLITRSVSVTLQLLINTQSETIQPNHVVA